MEKSDLQSKLFFNLGDIQMTVLNFIPDTTGQVGINPRIVKIVSDDVFATITASNYLQPYISQLLPTDILAINYIDGSGDVASGFFLPTIDAGSIIIAPIGEAGSVTLPVTAGHIAVFTNTDGAFGDDAATAINGGNIQAGLSGTAGALASFPATASKGSLKVVAVANTGDTAVTVSNRAHAQATVYSIGDVGQSTGSVLVSKVTADPNANLISFDVIVGYEDLVAGGSVHLIESSGSKQYKIRSLQLNSNGTNFSGGGGNRLGQVTDSTTVYSVVPAASLQTLANAQWGVTALPNPASAAINTSTAAGAHLVFKYSGGTTDYTAGSVVISGIAERVA